MPIQIENLTHTYMPGSPFQATAIRDISLTVSDSEFLGVIGHTGSGKSTLVQHLNGLLTPTSGRVLVDGVDVFAKDTNRKKIRQQVGLVFQYPEHQLFEETVEKDIAFGPKNLGLHQEEISKRVREACVQVGISFEEYGQRSPFELSGGQMRRVAIAGVLAMRPKVLVLDEPTAGLDPAGRDSILSMVKELHAAGGLTVIMVTHSMDDIARLATRLVVLSKGTLVLNGSPREVFSRVEEMEGYGLGVPQAAKLNYLLRKAGVNLPDDLYTLPEVQDHILRIWKEAGSC
jgi:energy-coupling factor transport system ATP-binding protein